jgi:uncharacterized protein YdbL (DUF1318 family)
MARTKLAAALGIALFAAFALAVPAAALELEAAKRDGLVGERADGFVGVVVANPSPEVRALVDSVNARRRAHYEEIAKRNGTAFDAVAAVAGEKLTGRAAPGEWITDAQGNWHQKK